MRLLHSSIILLLTPSLATAQAYLWTTTSSPYNFVPSRLVVENVDGGESRTLAETPAFHCFSGGTTSADGSTFYIISAGELLRFDVASMTQLSTLASPKPCPSDLRVSPDDRWWVFFGSGYAIVNASTRTTVYEDASASVKGVTFTPDGRLRFDLFESSAGRAIRAVRDPATITAIWQQSVASDITGVCQMVATPTTLYVLVSAAVASGSEYQLRAFDVDTGTENGRVRVAQAGLGLSPPGLLVAGGVLYVAALQFDLRTGATIEVATYDPVSLQRTRARSSPIRARGGYNAVLGQVNISADRTVVHVFYSEQYVRDSAFVVRASFDATSLQLLSDLTIGGSGFSRIWHLAAFDAPGVAEIQSLERDGNRIRVRWLPTPGPAPASFVIRGARRGEPGVLLTSVAGGDHEWESPPLFPGSYQLEIVATNSAATAAPSPLLVGIDEPRAPEAPHDLTASVVDDTAHLQWLNAAAGAAPEGYILEAAGALTAFVEIVRTTVPEFRALRVPPGRWRVRVRAFTSGGVSAPSTEVAVVSNACTQPPAPPAALNTIVARRAPVLGGFGVTLRWSAPSVGGAEDYIVEAGSSSGLTDIARIALASAAPSLDVAAPYGNYFVRVRARNRCGQSAPSNELMVAVR